MKKVIAVVLILVMCLGLAGCGNSVGTSSESGKSEISSEGSTVVNNETTEKKASSEWTVEDFYIYDENGEIQYRADDMRLSDLNKKSNENLQMKTGIKIGSTAKELMESFDMSIFYSAATPIGNSVTNIPENQQNDIDSFEDKYIETADRLNHIEELAELDLGLLLSNYFYTNSGEVYSCKTSKNGRQEDYEETKQFDRYNISFQIDKGVVSEVTIRKWDAQETSLEKIEEFKQLLVPVMKELGETKELNDFILYKAEKVSDDEDLGEYAKASAQGTRGIEVTYISDLKGEWRVQSVSRAGDAFHYFYYPNAKEVMKYSSAMDIKLYDYITDKKIDLSAQFEQNGSDSKNDFNKVLDGLGFKIEEANDGKETCEIGLHVDSSKYEDEDELAMNCLYQVSKLFLECLEMESCPYGSIGINFYVDDNNIGVMSVYTAFSIGLMGTNKPIIIDEVYQNSFDKMYEEYMSETDAEKYK